MSVTEAWLSYDDVPLKWQYPVGLLFDVLAGSSRVNHNVDATKQEKGSIQEVRTRSTLEKYWNLVVHFSGWPDQLIPHDQFNKTPEDAFFQSVKEADYLRNGTAKTILALSKEDSDNLWRSVREHDSSTYFPLYQRFLRSSSGEGIRNVPIKLYIPRVSTLDANRSTTQDQPETTGALRVVQGLVPPTISSSKGPQTLGTALHGLLPKLFPSRNLYIHARAVLHGVVVPLSTRLEDLMEGAAFCDGFLHIAVTVMEFAPPS